MDLAWWKWDKREDPENYAYLALHLERESLSSKDEETIEKLFSETEEAFIPNDVVGIQYVDSEERIFYLNKLVLHKNKKQQSNALMVYRYFDERLQLQRVWAYHFSEGGLVEERKAVCKEDEFGYYSMIFEEELQYSSKSLNTVV